MTKFTLKFKGKDITLFQDKKEIGETSDVEEAFAYIAYTIDKYDIEDHRVMVFDKGKQEVLEDFDYRLILKNSKNYNFDDEDDDNEKPNFGNDDEDPRMNRRQPKRRGFIYESTTTVNDYEKVGWAFRDAIDPERRVREE